MAVTLTTNSPVKKQISDAIAFNRGELYSGTYLYFDGVNDSIALGDTSLAPKTVVFWVKLDTTTEKILDLDGTYIIEVVAGVVTATGFTDSTIYVDGFASSQTLEAGVWYQIVITTTDTTDANAANIGIVGGLYYGFGLSNMVWYSETLTAAQVRELWHDPGRPVLTGLTAANVLLWYPLCDNNTNVFALDYSGNELHKTITGATYTNGVARPILQTANRGSIKHHFNGASDVDITGIDGTYTDMTIVCHFNITELEAGSKYLYWSNASIYAYFNPSNERLAIRIKGASADKIYIYYNQRTLVDTFLVFTYQQNGLLPQKLYINGTYVAPSATAEVTVGDITISGTLTLASVNSASYLKCIINSFAIYDTALNGDEVTEIYNSGFPIDLTSNTGDYQSAANLQGYWKNTGRTTWTELSGNATDGTAVGSPSTITFIQGLTAGYDNFGDALQNTGGVLKLNGSESISTPTNTTLELTTAVSLEAWVKFINTGSQETIIAKYLSFELAKGSGEAVIMSVYQTTNKTLITTTTLIAETWYHIVGTYDGTTMKVFINGVLDDSSTSYSGAFDSTSNPVQVGTNNGSSKWTGNLDECRVYNTALTDNQILNNYRAGLENHS